MRIQKKINALKMKQCSKSNRRRIYVIAAFCVGILFFVITWPLFENDKSSDKIEHQQYYSDGKHNLILYINGLAKFFFKINSLCGEIQIDN